MSRALAWAFAPILSVAVACVLASDAVARGGDLWWRGTPEWRLRLCGSGEDRYIAEVRADAYSRPDGPATICGVRVTELNSGTIPPPGAFGCELRLEDPANPGFPDLSQAGLIALADSESLGECAGPFYGRRVFTFGRGAGVPDPQSTHYMCAIEPLQGTGTWDFCSVLIDPFGRPDYWGASKVYCEGTFEALPAWYTLLLEAIVFQPESMDLNIRAHGSARFPGDPGIPAVFTNRPNSRGSITDDHISLTLSIDNATGGPAGRNLEVCADQSVVSPAKGEKPITGLFRPVGGGGAITNPTILPAGRTILRLEVSFAPPKLKIANIVDRKVLSLPIHVLVDDPAADTDPCVLDGGAFVDDERQALGLRRRAGSQDDNTAEAFFVVQTPNMTGDSLNVLHRAIDLPRTVAFGVTGFEVVGGEFYGSGLPGLDAIELRSQDPVFTNSPDLSRAGLLRSFGAADGVGEAPLPTLGAAAVFDIADVEVDPTGRTGITGNLYVLGLLLPGETSPVTAIAADQIPADTLLGDSSYTTSGQQPANYDSDSNYMLRLLLDGDRSTLDGPAPPATVSPHALLRRVGEFIAIDHRTGRRID